MIYQFFFSVRIFPPIIIVVQAAISLNSLSLNEEKVGAFPLEKTPERSNLEDPFKPNSNCLQPKSDGLQPTSDAFLLLAKASP